MTMWAAPREVRGYLDNLRSELYGERDYFKAATRSSKSKGKGVSRSHHDVGPLKILNDSVKHLMHKFKNLEEPFLRDPPSRKQMDVEKSEPSLRGDYLDMGLGLRYIWLRTKPDIISLANDVSRIQMRRLAFDTGSVLSAIHSVERSLRDFDDRLWSLEEHLLGEELEDGKIYVKRRYPDR